MPLNVTLASSLLDLETDQHRHANKVGGRTFKTGIQALDNDLPDSLWRGGDVVAVGTEGVGIKPGSLPFDLIVTHLLDQRINVTPNPNLESTPNDAIPSVFIIAPPYQATSSIQRVYTMLKSRLQHQAKSISAQSRPGPTSKAARSIDIDIENQTKSLLTSISLLQYLDISGLVESISEVLGVIQLQAPPRRSIVLVQGLTSTVSTTHRRSGTLQTAALLSSIMQGLGNVARTSHGLGLVLLEVDLVWDGGVGVNTSVNNNTTPDTRLAQNTPTAGLSTTMPPTTLKTAFSSHSGRHLRINTPAVFTRLIEDGTDVFVAVHDAEGRTAKDKGQRIVECVRDERGYEYNNEDVDVDIDSNSSHVENEEVDGKGGFNGFGSWAVWG